MKLYLLAAAAFAVSSCTTAVVSATNPTAVTADSFFDSSEDYDVFDSVDMYPDPQDEEFDFDSTDMYPEDEDEDFDFSEDLETAPEPELLQVRRGGGRNNPFRVLDRCLSRCLPRQQACQRNCRIDFRQNQAVCIDACNNNGRLTRQQRRNCRNDCRNRPNNGNNNPPPRPLPGFIGNRSPRVVRNGQRFRFNLRGENEQCVDRHNQLYQWGQFNQVRSFGDCATACVQFVPPSLLGNSFRGIEYIRGRNQCRCLYDQGFLNRSIRRLPGRFNRANTRERGFGSINRNGGRFNRNYFCGTLAGAEDEE